MKPILYFLMLLAAAACSSSMDEDAQEIDTLVVPESAVPLPDAPEEPVDVPDTPGHPLATEQEALEFMEKSAHAGEYAAGIIPIIARQNMEYANKLLSNQMAYFVIVDKESMHVILYDRYGVEQNRYKMCCSRKYGTKHARRDNRTPEGFFYAGKTYDSSEWLYTDDDGNTSDKKGQFGPRFIRITNPVTTQVGIHGTCAPWSLGGRSSHGCIRIHNDNIVQLVKYVRPGMPVIINPSRRDQKVNEEEGYYVPRLVLTGDVAGADTQEAARERAEQGAEAVREARERAEAEAEAEAQDDMVDDVVEEQDTISIENIFE